MIVRSDIITRATIGAVVINAGESLRFQDTNSRGGWYEPIREFTPRRFRNGYEFFLTGSSPRASAHNRDEKAATWIEWGNVIAALYEIDPDAEIGWYRNRDHFMEYTASEAERPGCDCSRSDMPWLQRGEERR